MKLYLLRHGDAVESSEARCKDAERPLTSKGIERTKLLAHALRQMEISFDTILSSPLVRARETAEIIARSLQLEERLAFSENLTLSGDLQKLVGQIQSLRPIPENVLLVGHEPHLSGLISLLCVGSPSLFVALKKGALCRLDIAVLTCGKCATLEWLLPPRLLSFKPSKRA